MKKLMRVVTAVLPLTFVSIVQAANPGTFETIKTVRGFVNSNGEPVESDLVTNHRDKVYTIRGIVTIRKGLMNVNSASSDAIIYVQDETGGIAVYDENNQAFPIDVNEGDYVEIKGRVGYFKGITQLNPQTNPGINVNADLSDDKTGKANVKVLGTQASPPVGITTKLGAPVTGLASYLSEPPTTVTCVDIGKDLNGLWPHQRTSPETPNNRAEALDGSLLRISGVRVMGIISSIVEDDVGTTPTIAPMPGGTWPDSWVPPYSRIAVQDQTGTAFLFISQRTDIDKTPAPTPTNSVDITGVLWQRYSPVSTAVKYLAYYNIGPRSLSDIVPVAGPSGQAMFSSEDPLTGRTVPAEPSLNGPGETVDIRVLDTTMENPQDGITGQIVTLSGGTTIAIGAAGAAGSINAVDRVTVHVWSQTDTKGFDLTLWESKDSSGTKASADVFRTSALDLSRLIGNPGRALSPGLRLGATEGPSDPANRLIQVKNGDIITVEYTDKNWVDPVTGQTRTDAFKAIGRIAYKAPLPPGGAVLRITDKAGNPDRIFAPERGEKLYIKFDAPYAPQQSRVSLSIITNYRVTLQIFDRAGRLVRSLRDLNTVDDAFPGGPEEGLAAGEAFWGGEDDNGSRLPVGVYLVHLQVFDPNGRQTATETQTVVLGTPLR